MRFSFALALFASASLAVLQAQTAAPAGRTWTGQVEITKGDDFDGGISTTHYALATPSGRIEFEPSAQDAARLKPGARVRLQGNLRQGRVAASGVQAAGEAAPGCSSLGEQRIAVINVAFPGQPPTYSTSALRDLTLNPGRSLASYWADSSQGRTWVTGDVFGPVQLGRSYSRETEYIAMLAEAEQAAAALGYVRSNYTRVFVVDPGTQGSVLGRSSLGCLSDGVSVAWIGARPDRNRDVHLMLFAHEGGHSLGLDEGYGRSFTGKMLGAPNDSGTRHVYADRFTAMGGRLSGYSAPELFHLGWLDPDQIISRVTPEGSYTFAPLSTRGNGVRAMRIQRPGTRAWIWFDYPGKTMWYDFPPPAGVVVRYEDASVEGVADLVDYQPQTHPENDDFVDAALLFGYNWSDDWSWLTIHAGLPGGQANLTFASPSCNASIASPTGALEIPQAGGSGELQVTAPAGCSWTARSSVPWVELLADSGTGSAALPFRVQPLTAAQEYRRAGAIAAGRSSVEVLQYANAPAAIDLWPKSGSGDTQTFTLSYLEAGAQRGWTSLSFAASDGSTCGAFVVFSTGDAGLALANATGEVVSDVRGKLGQGVLQNAACSLDLAASSTEVVGAHRFVRLALHFAPGFAGYMRVTSPGIQGGWWAGPTGGPSPVLAAGGIVNAANFAAGPLAPGEMVTIFGERLGPDKISLAAYDGSGRLDDLTGDVRVLFNGVPAPMVHAMKSQVTAIAPYGISGIAEVKVEYMGRSSNALVVPVAASAPGLFSADGSRLTAINQDGSVNSPERAVARGDVVTFFATGEGTATPVAVTGKLPGAPNWPAPAAPITVTVGGEPAEVQFKGLIYAGVLQLNVRIPASAPAGDSVPVTLKAGETESKPAAIALK